MKRILVNIKHYYYSFLLKYNNRLHAGVTYVPNIGHRVTFVYTLHSWDELDRHSARSIHCRVAKDTSAGNHGGY
jgi:hypothetical protein